EDRPIRSGACGPPTGEGSRRATFGNAVARQQGARENGPRQEQGGSGVPASRIAVTDPRWATAMSGPPRSADRNLLFGILALQMDFISRDALIEAMNAWVLDKGRQLGQILQDQGQLAPERLQLLETLVHEHLKAHGDDPQRSLAAVGQPPPVRR